MSDLYRLPPLQARSDWVLHPAHQPQWRATTGGTAAICGRCAHVVATRDGTTRAGVAGCPLVVHPSHLPSEGPGLRTCLACDAVLDVAPDVATVAGAAQCPTLSVSQPEEDPTPRSVSSPTHLAHVHPTHLVSLNQGDWYGFLVPCQRCTLIVANVFGASDDGRLVCPAPAGTIPQPPFTCLGVDPSVGAAFTCHRYRATTPGGELDVIELHCPQCHHEDAPT